MIVALMGFMSSGKSTIASYLSSSYLWPSLDLDSFIEQEENKTIAQLFREFGEDGFRQIEHRALNKVLTQISKHFTDEQYQQKSERDIFILALGGGSICRDENLLLIRKHCFCIYLQTSFSILLSRLSVDTLSVSRPLLQDCVYGIGNTEEDETANRFERSIKALLQERVPIYEQVADLTIATDHKSISQLSREIYQALHSLL